MRSLKSEACSVKQKINSAEKIKFKRTASSQVWAESARSGTEPTRPWKTVMELVATVSSCEIEVKQRHFEHQKLASERKEIEL